MGTDFHGGSLENKDLNVSFWNDIRCCLYFLDFVLVGISQYFSVLIYVRISNDDNFLPKQEPQMKTDSPFRF